MILLMITVQKLVTQIMFVWLDKILFISGLKTFPHIIGDLVNQNLLLTNEEKLAI